MPTARRGAILPGLEPTPEVVLSMDAAQRQGARRDVGMDLADALLGGPVAFMQTEQGPALINAETGEIVEDRSAAFAALLAFAADPSNHAAGLLDGDDGQAFEASTSFWRSSLRLDPNWMEAMRRRSRARASEAMRRMMDSLSPEEKLARKEGWSQRLTLKLITLTMPHHGRSDSQTEIARINRALALMKKREWWKRHVVGGIKGVEDALDSQGPHVHIHMLVLSRFIKRDELIAEWWECLDLATWETRGFGLAEDSDLVVDIRQVRKRAKSSDTVSWKDAVSETTKYVTKPADFLKRDAEGRTIQREVLLALCEVRRWPRMFELLGRCRKAGGASMPSELAVAASAALDLIHRAYSTGEWMKLPKEVGWEWVEGWDTDLDGPEELRLAVVKALQNREREVRKRPRPPSWRDLLDTLSLPNWLACMAERFRRGKAFRIRQILEQNPNGYLVDFNGKAYGCAPGAMELA